MDDGVGLWDLQSGKELAFLESPGTDFVLFEPSGALLTNGSAGLLRWPVQADAASPGLLRIGPPHKLLRAGPDLPHRLQRGWPGDRGFSIRGRPSAARRPSGPAGADWPAWRCAVRRREPRRTMGGHRQPQRNGRQDLGGPDRQAREGASRRWRLAGRLQPRRQMAGDHRGRAAPVGGRFVARKGPRSGADAFAFSPDGSCWRWRRDMARCVWSIRTLAGNTPGWRTPTRTALWISELQPRRDATRDHRQRQPVAPRLGPACHPEAIGQDGAGLGPAAVPAGAEGRRNAAAPGPGRARRPGSVAAGPGRGNEADHRAATPRHGGESERTPRRATISPGLI